MHRLGACADTARNRSPLRRRRLHRRLAGDPRRIREKRLPREGSHEQRQPEGGCLAQPRHRGGARRFHLLHRQRRPSDGARHVREPRGAGNTREPRPPYVPGAAFHRRKLSRNRGHRHSVKKQPGGIYRRPVRKDDDRRRDAGPCAEVRKLHVLHMDATVPEVAVLQPQAEVSRRRQQRRLSVHPRCDHAGQTRSRRQPRLLRQAHPLRIRHDVRARRPQRPDSLLQRFQGHNCRVEDGQYPGHRCRVGIPFCQRPCPTQRSIHGEGLHANASRHGATGA